MSTFNPLTGSSAFSANLMPGPAAQDDPPPPPPPPPPPDRRFVDVKDGKFIVIGADGKEIEADLGTLMMMVSMKRTENLDSQIALQLDDIQKRNAVISAMTDAMNKARQAKQDGGKDRGDLKWHKTNNPDEVNTVDGLKIGGTLEFLGIKFPAYRVDIKTGPDGKKEYVIHCHSDGKNIPLEDFKEMARRGMLDPAPAFEYEVPNPDNYKYSVKDPITGEMLSLRDFAKRYDIPWKEIDNGKDKDAWDANIANIKSRIDILNNDSQMANIKLQNVLEKRNNSFEMCTKVMQTNNSSIQSILRNL